MGRPSMNRPPWNSFSNTSVVELRCPGKTAPSPSILARWTSFLPVCFLWPLQFSGSLLKGVEPGAAGLLLPPAPALHSLAGNLPELPELSLSPLGSQSGKHEWSRCPGLAAVCRLGFAAGARSDPDLPRAAHAAGTLLRARVCRFPRALIPKALFGNLTCYLKSEVRNKDFHGNFPIIKVWPVVLHNQWLQKTP